MSARLRFERPSALLWHAAAGLPSRVLALLLLAACAPDPGELPLSCDPRELAAGEVRVKRIACTDELIGGEGRIGDWLLENAVARFVVRDTYAALTQLGEDGGTLVDAAPVGGADLLMELAPDGDRSTIEPVTLEAAAELRLPGFTWHLDADVPRLTLDAAAAPTGTWVPRPGVDRVGDVARSGTAFFSLDLASPPDPSFDGWGQVPVAGLKGVLLDPADRWPDVGPFDVEVNADVVEVLDGDRVVDRVPVYGGVATLHAPALAALRAARDGCRYDGLVLVACGGLTVLVRDDRGDPLDATVRFAAADHPLPTGGGRAPLGIEPGEVWVWAGPAYGAWHGWFSGGEDTEVLTLPRSLPDTVTWPEGAGPGSPATWSSGGTLLADFAVEAAPDADHAGLATVGRALGHAQGVGLSLFLADDEVPVVYAESRDETLTLVGTRTLGAAWSWGASATTRRAGHGAPDPVDPADLLTLVRGGAGADHFVIATADWAAAALAGPTPAWDWPVPPDGLWLDGPEDIPVLAALADAWIDAQPVSHRTWLPYVGVRNLPAVERALYDRTASAGNGPWVHLERVEAELEAFPTVTITAAAPAWMGPITVTLHTDVGTRVVPLGAAGAATVTLPMSTWAFAEVSTPRSSPWGGEPGWAVSGVRWVRGPAE